ncbi:hypothetical protein H4R19_005843 [Coemansia spiralis]|nr:hypothetical protein H4R19_005843 [Coemansia spiralis]
MSLSRLPQVALRRLVPALTAMPKSLDDDQLKKMMEQQQQQPHPHQPHQQTGGSRKTLLGPRPELSAYAPPQRVISALAKSSAPTDTVPAAIGRLLVSLGTSGGQGKLSPQDLALIKAATATAAREMQQDSPSLLTTPEPGSPVAGALTADLEPAAGMLDAASIDALVTALRGTAAISVGGETAATHGRATASTPEPAVEAVDEEASDDELAPIPADLSAAERRKEQNRRAQKKFRQKDKVRQKEVKWRAAQYDTLVESNKRFKRDIDDISRERDMYRQILEKNGISFSGAPGKKALLAPSHSPDSTVVASPLSPAVSLGGMDQLAQDTFGTLPFAQATSTMDDLLSPLMFADPMFSVTTSHHALPSPRRTGSGSAADMAPSAVDARMQWLASLPADPLLVEPPLVVDHASMDPQYAHQSTLDSQFVDPLSFIDELLASPNFASTSSPQMPLSRKRSYDNAMI